MLVLSQQPHSAGTLQPSDLDRTLVAATPAGSSDSSSRGGVQGAMHVTFKRTAAPGENRQHVAREVKAAFAIEPADAGKDSGGGEAPVPMQAPELSVEGLEARAVELQARAPEDFTWIANSTQLPLTEMSAIYSSLLRGRHAIDHAPAPH